VTVRLAYLCNLYPAVSHSFVRREIEAVEAAGHEVYRFSVRRARSDLKDPSDLREEKATEAILAQGGAALLLAWFLLLVTRPVKSFVAVKATLRLSAPGAKQKFLHLIYLLEAAWLARRLRALRVEHVHAHFGTNPAAVALLVGALGGPQFSFTVHGPDEFDAPVGLSLRSKIEASSFVATISSYARSQLMRWSPPSQWHKLEVIRCGLDMAFLDASEEPVDVNSTEFVCVARLSAQKGLPLLIAACAQLRSQGERFSLTIIGDGELREFIEAEIRRHGLEHVITLAGVQSAEEIRHHLRRARAFVLPSFAEGLPVVIMEALALGRPVITTAIAGIPELVDDQCGWLIPAGSEEMLAGAMSTVLRTSLEELTRKGAVGRERVRARHDASRNAQQLIEAFARK
jgi:glycosyltransferase involved in cell wall biosynthesis